MEFVLLATVAMSAISSLFLWWRVHAPGARHASLLLVACAEWTAAYAMTIASRDLSAKMFWDELQYLGIVAVPTLFLLFALVYTGRGGWITRPRLLLLSIMPFVTLLAVFTNGSHGLFWAQRTLETVDGTSYLVDSFAPGFWAHAVYSYVLLIAATVMLSQMLLRSRHLYGWQASALLAAIFIPWVANALTISGLSPVPWLDPTSMGFTTVALGIAAALSRLRHGDISAVSHRTVMENLTDSVLVLDADDRIVDLNPAAAKMLDLPRKEAQGKPIREVWQEWPEADEGSPALGDGGEVCLEKTDGQHIYDVRISAIADWRGCPVSRVVVVRDITDRKRAEQALQESEARYRDLFENATDVVYTIDLQGNFKSVNRAGLLLTGYTAEEARSLNIAQVLAPDQLSQALDVINEKLLNPAPTNREFEVVARDGRRVTLQVAARLIFEHGRPVGVQAIARDVTETRAMTQRLTQSIANLEATHDTAISLNSANDLDGLMRDTLLGVRRLMAPDCARLLVLDRDASTVVIRGEMDEDGNVEVTAVNRRPCPLTRSIIERKQGLCVADVEAEGAQRSSTMSGSVQAYAGMPLLAREEVVGILYVTYDRPHVVPDESQQLLQIIASHAAVAIRNSQLFEETKQAALTDALTGLPNHRHLMDQLDHEMERARRSGHPLAVVMMDVDGFKLVNDAHGHTVGDKLLRLVSRTLQETLRSTDIVGRYGGDEFMALLPETDRAGAEVSAARVMEAIRDLRFTVEKEDPTSPDGLDVMVPVGMSIGTAIYPYDSAIRMELISLADAAMYASKRGGGNTSTRADVTDSAFMAAQNTTFSVLEGLVNTVDAKDHYTRIHSEQVARHVLALADVLGMSEDAKRSLRIAGLLHDVGKIGIPDRILRKPGRLSEDEFDVIRQHPLLGEMIIREVPQLTEILEAVKHHHERYDGTGYPRGLQHEEVPIMARMIAVADAYSAMILDRPYRRGLSHEEAIAELRRGAGGQFDPELVEPFISALQTESMESSRESA